MNGEILRVVEIGRRFGGLQALRQVSFSVAPGEAVGIVGPNGSGKSTLFEIVSGARPPTSGRIYFNGLDITRQAAHQRCLLGIGRTFQMLETLGRMSVLENVLVAAMLRHSTHDARRRAFDLIERMGLADRSHSQARELSASELRRLDIARALATEPTLLLLDEPLAGLADEEIARSFDTLSDLHEAGLTIIMIEHRLEAMFGFVSRVIALNAGEVIAVGSPKAIQSNEQVISSYLGTEIGADA